MKARRHSSSTGIIVFIWPGNVIGSATIKNIGIVLFVRKVVARKST
jgi:hypothetical protein